MPFHESDHLTAYTTRRIAGIAARYPEEARQLWRAYYDAPNAEQQQRIGTQIENRANEVLWESEIPT